MCLLRSSWNFYVFEGTHSFVVVNLIWGVELYTCISFLLTILSVPEVLSAPIEPLCCAWKSITLMNTTPLLILQLAQKVLLNTITIIVTFWKFGNSFILFLCCFVFHVSGSQTWPGGPPALDLLFVSLTHLIPLISSSVETAKTKLGVFDYGDMQNVGQGVLQDRVGNHCFMWIHFEESTILYWNIKMKS